MDQDDRDELVSLFKKMIIVGKGRMTIVATTNYPWKIDTRIIEQFGARLYVHFPSQSAIQRIWKHQIEEKERLEQSAAAKSSEFTTCDALHRFTT